MPSLTHVCMWSPDDHCWKPITAEEASKLFPSKVSANSGLFMCNCCKQYVTLTNGRIQVRAFKHSRGEADKSCPERREGANYYYSYKASQHDLPIRITNITSNDFFLELGLIRVPQAILDEQKNKKITINTDKEQYTYSYERLKSDAITYLPVGGDPSTEYRLNTNGELALYWPETIAGITKNGRMFDKATGKALPADVDVQVGKTYYLLCVNDSFPGNSNIKEKDISRKQLGWCTWKVYELTPTAYTEDVAKFFLNFGYRLTERPTKIKALWPVHTENEYALRHNRDKTVLYIYGDNDIAIKTMPALRMDKYLISTENVSVVSFPSDYDQQLVSIGRSSVVDYVYYWKGMLFNGAGNVEVSIVDADGQAVQAGVTNKVPSKGMLYVSSQYDGMIVKERPGKLPVREKLNPDQKICISDITIDTCVKVYIGIDLVWQLKCEKRKAEESDNDEQYVRKLAAFSGRKMDIPYRFVRVEEKLGPYPRVCQWIRSTAKQGVISVDAYRFIKKIVSEL